MAHRGEDERRRQTRVAPAKRTDAQATAGNNLNRAHGDDHEYDPDHGGVYGDDEWDQEIRSLRTGAVKFTFSDGHDPDAVVDLRMGPDLGIYASTRSTHRRVDAVTPGRQGLLAAYSSSGSIAPLEWMHVEIDDDTGQAVALRVARDVAVRDVLIENRGSVGSAIDALREAAILADRHRLALEQSVERLGSALAESEARVGELTRLVESIQCIRVEHESKETADAWSFRTYRRPDGTDMLAVISADGVPRSTFCARPMRRKAIENALPVDGGVHHSAQPPVAATVLDDEDDDARAEVQTDTAAKHKGDSEGNMRGQQEAPTVSSDNSQENQKGQATAVDDTTLIDGLATEPAPTALAAAPADAEPVDEAARPVLSLEEPVVAAIPIPTTGTAAPLQQRRTKSGRKARSTATTLESPGSPPAARGVKTRQSARRASSHSASLGHAESLGAVTMARPTDDANTA
ncbi:hypothetical protein pkur_cds_192 [Pandoravirus kuranda]|uniref:Uncharacterized protein n=2 Tax=Pandoravirus TaxID=2060084 RepID=A0AA95J3G1_9VIRU|nr:hypothetical protein pneo_cds_214 [Pandoravirus neocaledonia]AVK75821.1 hypothetical protein pneo_cds_214 [Pandoravirus neocaledonia]WBR14367.1 hypothetical protein pkur_cds_192 [Pandoravirus kuranda]